MLQEITDADIQLAIEAHTLRSDSKPKPLKVSMVHECPVSLSACTHPHSQDLHARADLINAQDLPLSNVLGVQLPPPHMRGVVATPGPVPPASSVGTKVLFSAAASDLKESK